MYIPKLFAQPDIATMHTLIRAHPLATVVTLGTEGINANHIPLHLNEEPTPFGALRGHIARANPLFTDIAEDTETLCIFQGPQTYITPSWYATKQENGKVVPTWNYAVVHAYGFINIIDNTDWLRQQLEMLTAHNETAFASPWTLDDAPRDFIDRLLEQIVGFELVITRLLGKWKVSQNQPHSNHSSIIAGLKASLQADAPAMATLVETINQHNKR